MFGMRQSAAPLRGRSILALSTLALLASICFPLLAQAQSSAEIEYQDAPPTVPGQTGGNDAKDNDPSAHKANTGAGGGGSDSPGGGSGKGGSSHKAGDAAGKDGDQQGSQGQRGGEGSDATRQSAQAGTVEPAPEDDGGSSPLVTILIAIAVLAAISIAVVVIRQRRSQDAPPGSPASPEVG